MNESFFSQILEDARSLLDEQEVESVREEVERLKGECRRDPMKLYPKDQYRPRFVVWELTLRCNMRCAHCGSTAGSRRGDELSTEEALKLCDDLGALGCERLTLLGGEPFIREDWEAITARLQKNGVRVNVISNGWLTADPQLIQRIKAAGLTTLAISVDGYGPRHDELRKRAGGFERILKSFRLAQAEGLKLGAVTTVTRLVMGDLERIYQMLLEHGVGLWQIQLCTPQGRMQLDDPILPTPQDVREVADFIIEKKREGKIRIDPADNLGYYDSWELDQPFRSSQWGRMSFWNGCQAGCQVMGVDANGDIKGCLSLPSVPEFIEGNIRQQSLAEIWAHPGAFSYNREFNLEMLKGECASCEYGGLCRAGCVSHAWCSSGDRGDNPSCLHRWKRSGEL